MLKCNQKITCKLEAFCDICLQFAIENNKCTTHTHTHTQTRTRTRTHTYIYIKRFIYLKYSHTFRCTSLITFRWPYVFYINSLQDHTYKTVQTVHTATKLTTSMYCNYNSWQLTVFYRLYFNINCNDNILVYRFYWVCDFNDFCNFSKVEG